MDRPLTVSGLLAKRAELAGKLKFLKAEVRKVICDLDHLDATIRLFDPDADTSRVARYPTQHRAQKGELTRFVLGALRTARKPLTVVDLTDAMLSDRRLKADHATVVMLRKRMGACLRALKLKGVVSQVPRPGEYRAWVLVTDEEAV